MARISLFNKNSIKKTKNKKKLCDSQSQVKVKLYFLELICQTEVILECYTVIAIEYYEQQKIWQIKKSFHENELKM